MGNTNLDLKLHVAVGVWMTMADTDIHAIEQSNFENTVAGILGIEDKSAIKEETLFWMDKFKTKFPETENEMIQLMNSYGRIGVIKESLLDVAQRVIVSDGEIQEQEEAAIVKLKNWLKL